MKIINLSNIFYKFASIKSDMANRIMYSIIQPMSKTVDYPAIDLAVHGAKDIIIYGTTTCFDEISHYYGYIPYAGVGLDNFGTFENSAVNKNTLPTYIKYLKLFEEAFADVKNWNQDYGGKAWENIAKTLKDLSISYLEYLSTPKYSENNLKAAKDVLINLNLFDGLSHNTSEILAKLINSEKEETGITTNFDEIQNLMDAKELKDPIDVYNSIKKEIPIDLPYKDYIEILRSNPEFYKKEPEKIKREMSGISFARKAKREFNYGEEIKDYIFETEKYLNMVLELVNEVDSFSLQKFNRAIHNVEAYMRYLKSNINIIIKLANENPSDLADNIKNQLIQLLTNNQEIALNLENILFSIKNKNIEKIKQETLFVKDKIDKFFEKYIYISNQI